MDLINLEWIVKGSFEAFFLGTFRNRIDTCLPEAVEASFPFGDALMDWLQVGTEGNSDHLSLRTPDQVLWLQFSDISAHDFTWFQKFLCSLPKIQRMQKHMQSKNFEQNPKSGGNQKILILAYLFSRLFIHFTQNFPKKMYHMNCITCYTFVV